MGISTLIKKPVKKSQLGFVSWFFVIVILLAVALFLLVLNKTWGEIKTPLGEGLNNSVPEGDRASISGVLEQTGSSTQSFDKLLPFLIIGLFAFVMILAGSIMKHPIMIFVGLIIMAGIILVAVVYSNLYENITDTDAFSGTDADLPIQNKFMQYLPYIIFIMAIAIGVSLLWRNQGGVGL